MMATTDLGSSLQHPRRSLGNRHRSQAEKFFKLSNDDKSNLSWAEQSARQAVLHDFTHPDNWRTLLTIKLQIGDHLGARAVLDDLFLILGRDPELLSQLDGVNLGNTGLSLLEGALSVDPLDPDDWWDLTSQEGGVEAFCERIRNLDFTDQRANILFSRRMERLLDAGHENEYLELTRKLLAQRPSNHEAWDKMGKLHERRGEFDQAWLCYDQAQSNSNNLNSRDDFKVRMESLIDGKGKLAWKAPDISDRLEFLSRMQVLARPTAELMPEETQDENTELSELDYAKQLFEKDRLPEAFFIARRLAAEGDSEAKLLAEEIQGMMQDE
tara:strand:- start:5303 stop:6283 length:981 start_codon:yes stop_codon:yes gene_type:complete